MNNENISDLRRRLIFVILALIMYRLGSHVPVPFIDTKQLMNMFSDNESGIFNLFNLFSGGALAKVTIFSLGIMPYISSSIIIQMLGTIWEPIKKFKKDASGKRKIAEYTKYLTLILSLLQASAMSGFMTDMTYLTNINLLHRISIIVSLVSGTMILIWLGELINEKGIGNGISLIIFTNIISNIPRTLVNSIEKVKNDEIAAISIFFFILILIFIIFFIIFVEMAQKHVIVNYAKRQIDINSYSYKNTYIPFKINMSGVIPPIFASSIILFPATIIQWIEYSMKIEVGLFIKELFTPGKPIYILAFSALIIFFSFFYTTLVFNSKDISENLKRSGGFILGVRPGDKTTDSISKIVTKLTFIGSIYLTLVCIIPEMLLLFLNVPFYFGGTSLLIIVVVIIDFVAQVQTRLISYRYDNIIKKYTSKSN